MASASASSPQKEVPASDNIDTTPQVAIAPSPLYTSACFEPTVPHTNPAVVGNHNASSTITSVLQIGDISSSTTRASSAGIRKTSKTTTNTRIFSKLHRHTTAQRYILRRLAGDIKGDIPLEQGNQRPTGSAGPFAVKSHQLSHSHHSHCPQQPDQPHPQQQERREEMADITNNAPKRFTGSGIVQAALKNAILLAAKNPPPAKEGDTHGTMELETRKRSNKGGSGGHGSVRGSQRNQKGVKVGNSGSNQAQERLQQNRAKIPTSQALDRVKGASVAKSSKKSQNHRITASRKSVRGKGSKLNPDLKRSLEKEMGTGGSQGRGEGSAALLPAPILERTDTSNDGEGKRVGKAGAVSPVSYYSGLPNPNSRHAQHHVSDDEEEDGNPGYDGCRHRHRNRLLNQPDIHQYHQQAGPNHHSLDSSSLPNAQNPHHHRHHDPSDPNHTYYDPYDPSNTNNNNKTSSSPSSQDDDDNDNPLHTGYTPRSTPPPLNNKYTTQIRLPPHRTRHMIRAALRLGLNTGTLIRPPRPSKPSSSRSSRGSGLQNKSNSAAKPGLREYTAGLWVDNRRDSIMKGIPPLLVPVTYCGDGNGKGSGSGSGSGFAVDGGRGYTVWDEDDEDDRYGGYGFAEEGF
ncbi:uncharacterized protein C8A04DRAFT_29571 [Dichotomopilus funicola]|uniref:Uncharacterized protein n=1 Tax=Dichotomopilus funicola TaxID=1934379 RepID=A0AAN6V0V0_9PEZI|nr:hypothetical protein C8A04DRAFT_29571 [Dichotomopilus funicola]